MTIKIPILLTLFLYATNLLADESINRENHLKAVYLVHFAELTRWPEKLNQQNNFKICLFKNDALKPFLEQLKSELIHGKQLEIEEINSIDIQKQCQIIYFHNIDNIEIEQPFSKHPETLFVGNNHRFIDSGGSISFNLVNNKIKLIINLKQIRQSGLDINSKLLRIAEVIE